MPADLNRVLDDIENTLEGLLQPGMLEAAIEAAGRGKVDEAFSNLEAILERLETKH